MQDSFERTWLNRKEFSALAPLVVSSCFSTPWKLWLMVKKKERYQPMTISIVMTLNMDLNHMPETGRSQNLKMLERNKTLTRNTWTWHSFSEVAYLGYLVLTHLRTLIAP